MPDHIKSQIAKLMIEKLGLNWTPQLEREAIAELDAYLSDNNQPTRIASK